MKKKYNKNYIAFTLTEMTMVLLIMSIIAAASAPLVKNAVNEISTSATAVSGSSTEYWTKAEGSDANVISYASSSDTNGYGMVSIGTIPSANPASYDYPALIVQANSATTNDRSSQIGIYAHNPNNSTFNYGRIAMDGFDNMLVGSGHRYTGSQSGTLPYDRIEIGYNIGSYSSVYSQQSVSLGSDIFAEEQSPYYAYAISIGNYIGANPQADTLPEVKHSATISIGNYALSSTYATTVDHYASIAIGSYAGYAMNINLGNTLVGYYAGFGSKSKFNVAIGSFAGGGAKSRTDATPMTAKDVSNNQRNVYIGRYAGYVLDNIQNLKYFRGPSSSSYIQPLDYYFKNNVGYERFNSNVFIGEFAGALTSIPDIMPGYSASGIINRKQSIAIGQHAFGAPYANILFQDIYGETYSSTNKINVCGYISNDTAASAITSGSKICGYGKYAKQAPVGISSLNGDIAIGAFAGSNIWAPYSGLVYENAMTPYQPHGWIFIGPYAGSYTAYMGEMFDHISGRRYDPVISIGPDAGSKSMSDPQDLKEHLLYANSSHQTAHRINLGYRAGLDAYGASVISIGDEAGFQAKVYTLLKYYKASLFQQFSSGVFYDSDFSKDDSFAHLTGFTNMFIGKNAGKNSKGNCIGIGINACSGVDAKLDTAPFIYNYPDPYSYSRVAIGNFQKTPNNNAWSNVQQYPANVSEEITKPLAQMYFRAASASDAATSAAANSDIILAAKTIYAKVGSITQISSDARRKKNIKLSKHSLKDFSKFNIYNFNLKNDPTKEIHIGVIAQEYRKAFPLGVVKKDVLIVDPEWLYYSMINAIKDLDKKVQEFKQNFEEYVNTFVSVKDRINDLEENIKLIKFQNDAMKKQLDEINKNLN